MNKLLAIAVLLSLDCLGLAAAACQVGNVSLATPCGSVASDSLNPVSMFFAIAALDSKTTSINSLLLAQKIENDAAISLLRAQVARLETKTNDLQRNLAIVSQKVSSVDQLNSAVGQLQTRTAALERVQCRVCFQETEGSSQCQGSRSSCSGWSKNPSWTSEFRDDTDNRSGGCKYSWKLECRQV